MPMAMATCWLSATARMAMPLRDQRKNHPKAAMKKMLTDAPRSWMGGMNKGPITKGSSLMGRGKGFVPAPKKVGPTPRRIEASPMVAMTTAIIGRPISFRRTTRSRAKPNTIMLASPRRMATHRGAPAALMARATTSPAIITNSPWAKFTASVALYTRTKPRAIREYMRPMSSPLERRRRKKPNSSDMGRRPLHILDTRSRLDRGLPPILVGDGGGQLYLGAAAVEGVDHRGVLLRHEAAAHLAGACHLRVVGLEILGEEEEAADLRAVGQGLIGFGDLARDELPHLGLLGEIRVGRVGQPAAFRPVAHRGKIDGDHGGHEGLLVPEAHRLPDVRAELELVLDELRGEGCAVGERAHVLGAVDDDEMAARVEEAGVARVEPAVGVDDLARGLLVLEVALEHRASAHEHFAAVGDLHLHARDGTARCRGIGLRVRLQGHETARLRRTVDLLEVDPDGSEEAEGVGPEGRTARERPLRLPEPELIAHGAVDEKLAEGGDEAEPARHALALRPQDLRPLRCCAEEIEGAPLERRGVVRADLDGREHVLPDARRGEHGGRTQLAEIALHRLRALRAVGAEAGDQAREERVDGIARPRHRQVREGGVLGPHVRFSAEDLRHSDRVGVGDHGTLGMARGARGVADDGDVVRFALIHLGLEVARIGRPELPSRLLHVRVG